MWLVTAGEQKGTKIAERKHDINFLKYICVRSGAGRDSRRDFARAALYCAALLQTFHTEENFTFSFHAVLFKMS